MKRCTKCGEEKPLTEFHKRAASPDGLNYKCRGCAKALARGWHASHRSEANANRKARYIANREHELAMRKKWRQENPERAAAIVQQWTQAHKAEKAAGDRSWRQRNVGRLNAHSARKRAEQRSRTPEWADLNAIRQVYERARVIREITGEEVHVDHIYPLRGKTVSGLHVHNNLRVVLKEENLRKGNKLIEEA